MHRDTPFENYPALKLVLPCNNSSGNDLIIKEYLCYKMYEQITPLSFHTRLVTIRFLELNGKKRKETVLKGILIEDIRKLCKRVSMNYMQGARVYSHYMEDTAAARLFLFQYMISNTDWSTYFQHNIKTVKKAGLYYALPYDFDMSGVVDAPYAVVSEINGEKLNAETVRDRVYRGSCIASSVMDYVRKEFLQKREAISQTITDLNQELPASDISGIQEYIDGFFGILSNERSFHSRIVEDCISHH